MIKSHVRVASAPVIVGPGLSGVSVGREIPPVAMPGLGWTFTALFVLALVVRIAFVLLFAAPPKNDMLWNDAVGWNLAQGHGFTASQHEPRVPGVYRTPGYPFFLAGVYSLFGHSHLAAYLAQALLDSISAVLIGLIGLALASAPLAVVTSVLYAVYPYAAIHCGVLHQDILLTFATLLVLFLLTRALQAPCSLVAWASIGVASGALALVKANFLVFAVVPVVTMWSWRPRLPHRLAATVVVALGIATVISPWVVRNYLAFGAFPPLAAGATGTNLTLLVEELRAGEAGLVAKAKSRPDATQPGPYLDNFIDGAALIAAERQLALTAAAELARRWPEYLALMLQRPPRLWLTRDAMGYSALIALAGWIISWGVLGLGVAGMWILRHRWRELLPLLLTVGVVTAMYMPYTAEARYTLPARPAMLLFVAALMAAAQMWLPRRRGAVVRPPTTTPG